MQVYVRGKNLHLAPEARDYATEKIAHLAHYLDNIVDAHVTIRCERKRYIMDVTLYLPHMVLKAEERSTSIQASTDLVRDRLEQQIRKYKTKHWDRRHHGNGSAKRVAEAALPEADLGDEAPLVAKTKRFAVKPMHADEAAEQMKQLGHDFFVFLNAETDQVNVLYKRKKGNFGLLEPVR